MYLSHKVSEVRLSVRSGEFVGEWKLDPEKAVKLLNNLIERYGGCLYVECPHKGPQYDFTIAPGSCHPDGKTEGCHQHATFWLCDKCAEDIISFLRGNFILGEHPGFRLVGPKVSLEQIIKWAEEYGLDVRKLESTYEHYGWPEGSHPSKLMSVLAFIKLASMPKQVLLKSWKVVADDEIGIYFVTGMDVLDRWSDAKLADLEAFIMKLQKSCRELYFFEDFNGTHWWALDKYGKIPWRPVPKKNMVKSFVGKG